MLPGLCFGDAIFQKLHFRLIYIGDAFLEALKPEGVYPQSDRSLAIVDIDASKGFVDLWVQLSFAIFAIFYVKRQLKLLEMACNQVRACLIFPLRWAGFPIKIGRNAQWELLFSMYFDEVLQISLIFFV